MAGGATLVDHVRTQIPYALLAAVASFIAYLIVGVTQMAAGIACRWRWRFWWCCSCWLPGCAARKLRKKVEQL